MTNILGNDLAANRLVEAIAGSTGSLVQSDTSTSQLNAIPLLDTGLLGDLPTQDLTGGDIAGQGATLQPILDTANTTVLDVHEELEILGHELGVPFAVHGVTSTGEAIGLGHIGDPSTASDGHTNLVSNVLNAPGDILSGDTDQAISNVGHDLTDTVNAAAQLKDTLIFPTVGQDPTNPVPELIQSVGQTVQTLPLLDINGGDSPGNGLLSGSVLDVSHSSTNHLLDIDLGPITSGNNLVLNLLSGTEAGPHHAVELNILDVGPDGPHLGDLSILTGLGDTGVGGLLNDVLGNVGGTTGGSSGGLLNEVLGTVGSATGDSSGGLLNGVLGNLGGTAGGSSGGADGLVGHVLSALPVGVGSVLDPGSTSTPATHAPEALPLHDIAAIPDVVTSLLGNQHGLLHDTHLI
jgi:hypothetical protein